MEAVTIDQQEYYTEEYLKTEYPVPFHGCSRSRSMVKNKKIPVSDYIYALYDKKTGIWRKWNPVNDKTKVPNLAKLLVSKRWVNEHIIQNTVKERNDPNCQTAPPVIKLGDDEKFRDQDGNIVDIEVRGNEKHWKTCYFKMKDISDHFTIPNLYETLTNKTSGYMEGKHYKQFICVYPNIIGVRTNKFMFLTYNGVLKVLFSSRTGNAESFQDWATEKLFTIQMGTKDQKDELASALLGVSADLVHRFMNVCVRDLALVYLIHLGSVPDDIEVSGNKEDFFLLKTGSHKNDTREGFIGRSRGHMNEFKEFRKQMSYLNFLFLDPQYVSDVEKEVKIFLQDYKLCYKNKNEVFLIPKNKLDSIQGFFKELSYKYSGNAYDIQREFDNYKASTTLEINLLKTENTNLKEKLEDWIQKVEEQYKTIIEGLNDRILEQKQIIKAFLMKMTGN